MLNVMRNYWRWHTWPALVVKYFLFLLSPVIGMYLQTPVIWVYETVNKIDVQSFSSFSTLGRLTSTVIFAVVVVFALLLFHALWLFAGRASKKNSKERGKIEWERIFVFAIYVTLVIVTYPFISLMFIYGLMVALGQCQNGC